MPLSQPSEVNWSDAKWADWIQSRVEKRLATFANEPGELIAAYNRECSNIDDYRGREILELLQNADDAGVSYGPNQAFIQYWPEGICVANTGVPFSKGGVESLFISNLSPKKLDRSRHIGNRGLGFRSILAWTNSPFILSGNLRLAFCTSLAASALTNIMSQSTDVREKVEEWRTSGHDLPMPILACPAVLNEKGEGAGFQPPSNFQLLWKHALELRNEYDTVIAIPFTEDHVSEEVLQQIEGLPKELMLFLQHLEKIILNTPKITTTLSADRNDDQVCITSFLENSNTTCWRIFQKKGIIPKDLLAPGQRSTPTFDIKIAVSENPILPCTLFNYFPTKVRFPYPVVAHVTIELTSNRQNIIESKANRFMVNELAGVLVDVAEQSTIEDDPWHCLKLISAQGTEQDPSMEALGFQEALLDVARKKRLIPRRDGKLALPSETKRFTVDPHDWLPLDSFNELALWTDDYGLNQMQDKLDVPFLSLEDFHKRIEQISSSMILKQRVALLNGLLNNPELVQARPPNLLIDQTGRLIEPEEAA